MCEYEITLEIHEREGAALTESPVPSLVEEGLCAWMCGDEDELDEKEIDPDGVTTEFVRCPDPTACGIVMKIMRIALPE